MYNPDQPIYDKDKGEVVRGPGNIWDTSDYPRRSTHLRWVNSKQSFAGASTIAGPTWLGDDVLEACALLAAGLIEVAPTPSSHCDNCGNWRANPGWASCEPGVHDRDDVWCEVHYGSAHHRDACCHGTDR